eukprot:628946-Rhodomonas_salina.1
MITVTLRTCPGSPLIELAFLRKTMCFDGCCSGVGGWSSGLCQVRALPRAARRQALIEHVLFPVLRASVRRPL